MPERLTPERHREIQRHWDNGGHSECLEWYVDCGDLLTHIEAIEEDFARYMDKAGVAAAQPCGHPVSAIASSDEGTCFCWACAMEAERAEVSRLREVLESRPTAYRRQRPKLGVVNWSAWEAFDNAAREALGEGGA